MNDFSLAPTGSVGITIKHYQNLGTYDLLLRPSLCILSPFTCETLVDTTTLVGVILWNTHSVQFDSSSYDHKV